MRQRLNRKIAWLFVMVVASATVYSQGMIEGRGTARRFVSEKYGFTVAVPPGWLVDPSANTPIFFSFTPAEAQDFNHQLKLPRGGAVISIVASAELPGARPRTLSDWASADARGSSSDAPSVHSFEAPPNTGVTAAVISSFDSAVYGPQDQSEHHVSIFWEFRHALFVTHLVYPAHDPKGPGFDAALETNFSSIRPLRDRPKR